jgi:hypothetical protein
MRPHVLHPTCATIGLSSLLRVVGKKVIELAARAIASCGTRGRG